MILEIGVSAGLAEAALNNVGHPKVAFSRDVSPKI
jgi:hypothetical protein